VCARAGAAQREEAGAHVAELKRISEKRAADAEQWSERARGAEERQPVASESESYHRRRCGGHAARILACIPSGRPPRTIMD
jgi:hypothetical protein